ncbi:G-protein coupled receptor 55-like [Bufo bufo]|uniref:G-protein coupled receptor 55-like n=1 Tax=Bufo bufo TaxID=8384 RepID=UPI001ABE1873|nr:G-protein coupled receptor 55-like [Bufo bufo]
MSNFTDIEKSVELFQLIVYIPTFIFGLIFNTIALWMLFFRIKKWMETTTYMATLILFDSLLLITLPFKIKAYNVGEKWTLGSGVCTFLESLYFVNMYGSIFISVCICMDRYIAIQFPFYSKVLRSPKKATIICILVCITVWGSSTGFLLRLKDNNESHCFYGFSDATWRNIYLVIMLELVFLFSAALLTFCTAHILLTFKNKIQNDLYCTSRGQKKSTRILLVNLLTFLFSFGPFHLSLLLYFLVKNGLISEVHIRQLRIFIQVSLCIANTNCFLDGVCYYYVLKEFVKANRQPVETR